MAQREIVVAGNPVLRQKSIKIRNFGASIEDLVTDMLDTMRSADGLGLAAPQIGVPLRLIVIETQPADDDEGNATEPSALYVYCNPEIVESSGEEEADEGCLSVPGYVGAVTRATSVTVKGQDARGRKVRTKAEGLLARAFQHEIDHLNGTLFIDRVDSPEKLRPTGSENQESERDTTLQ